MPLVFRPKALVSALGALSCVFMTQESWRGVSNSSDFEWSSLTHYPASSHLLSVSHGAPSQHRHLGHCVLLKSLHRIPLWSQQFAHKIKLRSKWAEMMVPPGEESLSHYLGMFPGGDQRPHSQPDGPLPVDVKVSHLVRRGPVPVPAALSVSRGSGYF